MAESRDRAAAAAGGAEPYPGLAAAPQVTSSPADAAYRPLSIPAVVGCAVAALYAAFLVVCWTASFLTGMPLYLPYSSLLVPAVAVVLSALGWLQVQRSEGTRAGGGLAVWGMALGGLFGLGYWAYLTGTRLAVGAQAQAFADGWIDQVRKGQLDEAFRLTVPPDQRPQAGPDLRRNLELRFNSADPAAGRPGAFTAFRDSDAVLLLNHGRNEESGGGTTVRPLGLKEWSYSGRTYHVLLEYELQTAERSVHLQVALQGTESSQEGRQWAVITRQTQPRPPFEEQPLGARVMALKGSSSAFMNGWLAKVGAGQGADAYLETLEPARRRELQAAVAARLVGEGLAPGVGPAVGAAAGRQELLPGYREFQKGNIIRADQKTFWAEGPLRTAIPAEVRRMFSRAPRAFAVALRPNPMNMVAWDRDGDKVRFANDFQLIIFPRYLVEGTFVVETDAAVLDDANANPVWRVAAIDLTAGRSGPGGAGAGPAGKPGP